MDDLQQVGETQPAPGLDTHLDIEQEPALSIADHAAQFGPNATPSEETDDAAAAVVSTPHSATTQRREDNGQWRQGRHRAKSQQAGPGDAPRIAELTGKWRTAEQERDALRAEVERLKAAPRQDNHQNAAQTIARVEPTPSARPTPAAATSDDPEPDPADTTTYADGQYDRKFMTDYARWAAREEHREIQKRQASETAEQARGKAWSDNVTAARAKYPDYDAIAFAPTLIKKDTPIDVFIMEDESGAEVLYHLQKNPAELHDLLGKPALAQLKALSLLSQRLTTPPTRAQAVATGSAATPQIRTVPRPPNPVRTGAHSVSDAPPPTDGSLSLAQHARAFGPPSARR